MPTEPTGATKSAHLFATWPSELLETVIARPLSAPKMSSGGGRAEGQASCGYLYADYLENFQRNKELDRNSLKLRCNRIVVQSLAHLCHVDIYGWRKPSEDGSPDRNVSRAGASWQLNLSESKPIEHSAAYRRQRFKWVANLILCAYFIANILLLANLYFQYAYDFDQVRLIKLKLLQAQNQLSAHQFDRYTAELRERMHETLAALIAIGSPHRHLPIVVECHYVYLVTFTFVLYFCSYIYYQHLAPFDLHFVRELIDHEGEEHRSRQLVETQVLRFIESNRIFTKILMQGSYRPASGFRLKDRPRTWMAASNQGRDRRHSRRASRSLVSWRERKSTSRMAADFQRLSQNDCRVHRLLISMLTSGALRPFNKSPGWCERRVDITYMYHGSLFIYLNFFSIVTLKLSIDEDSPGGSMSWSDMVMLAAVLFMLSVLSLSANFFSTYIFVGSLDQIVMVSKMRELVLNCIRLNTREFMRLTEARGAGLPERDPSKGQLEAAARVHEESTCADKMNTNYLFVMMQFKIFVAQHKSAQRTVESIIIYIAILVMLIPIICKLHIPYLNLLGFVNVRWFAVLLSTVILVPTNFGVVPTCYLHARCVNLYRVFSSLIAHIIEIESHPMGRGIYDEHAVSLLFKELRHPFQFMDQFKASSLGFSGTYNALVKIHFWWGILVLSILVDDEKSSDSGPELLSSFFKDPLAVFSQLNANHN